jgi:uncharacterized protein (DUF1015 family)
MVTAPPYDVISEDEQAALYERHPANVIRVILNRSLAQDDEKENVYTRAADFFEQWQTEGLLVPEPEPAFYAYTQRWSGIERKGIIALLQLESLDSGNVLPHEHTLGGPKMDRLNLMRATMANLSQIFMIYDDPALQMESLVFDPATYEEESWLKVADNDKVVHRLKPISESKMVQRLQEIFQNQKLLIADGHHRYETALTFQREAREYLKKTEGAEPPPGSLLTDYVMVFLTNMEDSGLRVYPTHRVLYHWPEGWTQKKFEEALLKIATPVETRATWGYEGSGGGAVWNLKLKDQSCAVELPEILKKLDVAILDSCVFQKILGANGETLKEKGILGFYRDAKKIREMMDNWEAVATFYMEPPSVRLVRDISEAGYRMPQKSTYFYPKLLSGLVFYTYRAFVDSDDHALIGVIPDVVPFA